MEKQEFYNVKFKDFGNGEMQVVTYERPINKKSDIKKNGSKYRDDIEIKLVDLTEEYKDGNIDFSDVLGFIESDNRDKSRSLTSSTNRAKNKVYDYARTNAWEWFVTWTFDPSKIDSTDYDVVTKKLSQWLKRMRKDFAPNLRYIVVPELHDGEKSTVYCEVCGEGYKRPRKKCPNCGCKEYRNAFHFHALMSNTGRMKLDYSGYNCVGNYKFESTEDSGNGKPIYNLGNYRFGWTTVTKVEDTHKVSFYLSKYITKTLCAVTKGKRRYWPSQNLELPKIEKMMMSDGEIKKLLESIKEQIAYKSDVSVDLADYRNKISYYEISVSQT